MSISKLLTRGSKSRRWQTSNVNSEHTTPSAGALHLSQGYQPQATETPTTPSRGKKRKRGETTSDDPVKVPDELDFFAGGVKLQNQPNIDEEPRAQVPARQTSSEHCEETNGVVDQGLDKVSCRQILKRQRLKITLLKEEDGILQHTKQTFKGSDAGTKRQGNSKEQVQLTPRPLVTFEELRSRYRISRRLADNLKAQGYIQPTEVQLGSLPLLLGSDEDRGLPPPPKQVAEARSIVDLLTVAPTGSGKTLAFLVNVLSGLIEQRHTSKKVSSAEHDSAVHALIITPTHELANQIVNEGKKLAVGTGISISALRRGTCLHPQLLESRGEAVGSEGSTGGDDELIDTSSTHKTLVKTSILVSTPPLLLAAITPPGSSEPLPLPQVRYLILDEADLVLSLPFQPITLKIWSAVPSPHLQTSLWSATIGSSIESLTQDFITQRRQALDLSSKYLPSHHLIRLIVGLKDSAIPNVSHKLTYAATEQGKLLALRQLLNASNPDTVPASTGKNLTTAPPPSLRPPFLVFTQTIPRAIALHAELKYDIPPEAGGVARIAVLHSDLSSPLRSQIMAEFRKGEIWVLITTDLLSRGVDFRGLNGVVNYDIPVTSGSYIHRAGRTGRQGREGGVVVTLYTKEDIPYVKNIANVIAASEKSRAKAKVGNTGISAGSNSSSNAPNPVVGGGGGGIDQWLLDALPTVSKNTRKQLRKTGVESRRKGFEDREGRRSRISTKSGYERKLEQRRKRPADGRPQGQTAPSASVGFGSSEGWVDEGGIQEWSGFED